MKLTDYKNSVKMIFLAALIFLSGHYSNASDKVYIKDFGAVPNDAVDDAPAIRKAIQHAKENGLTHFVFEAGTYFLKSSAPYTGLGHRHLAFIEMDDIVVEGQVDANGQPATTLLRHNPAYTNGKSLPGVVLFKDCNGVVFKNFVMDNDPDYCTAGVVTDKGADFVEVEIFEGNPVFDGSPCITANAWDLETRTLKKVPSLTFGQSPANWQRVGDEESRKLRIEGVDFTKYLDKGDGISWHLGMYGKQIQFDHCQDVKIENILTLNTAGFALETINCRNIEGKNVIFRPDGNQLALGSRDAWKIALCSGEISVDGLYAEGVRWDGQNIHGNFLYVDERLSSTQVRMFKAGGAAPILETGSKLGFWNGKEIELMTIANWSYEGNDGNKPVYTIEFEEELPSFIESGSFATVYCLNAEEYTLSNSTFRNIAGCASVIKQENATVKNCTFEYIMYPPIILGAERSGPYWFEGTFPRDVTIRDCTFANSGWVKRLGLDGMIGVGYWGNEEPYMRNITIKDNTFQLGQKGINVQNCDTITIQNNQFIDIGQPIVIQESTVSQVLEVNNSVTTSVIPLENSTRTMLPTQDGYLKFNVENLITTTNRLEFESHSNAWPRDIVLGFDTIINSEVDSAYVVLYCSGVSTSDRPETNPFMISGADGALFSSQTIGWSDTTLFKTRIDTIRQNQHDAPRWFVWNVTDFINTMIQDSGAINNPYFRIYSLTGSYQLYYFESSRSPSGLSPALVLYEKNNTTTLANKKISVSKTVRVYPNPFRNEITVEYRLNESGKVYLSLYDSNGVMRQRLVDQYDPKLGTKTVQLENLNLPPGIYYCQFKSNEKTETFKLLK